MTEKVLLIEDEPLVTDFIVVTLKLLAIKCTHAADGETGARMYEHDPTYTTVICDFTLPRLNGYGVFVRVQDLLQARGTRFVSCTGGVWDPLLQGQLDLLRSQPAVRRLDKPFTLEALCVSVGRHADELRLPT